MQEMPLKHHRHPLELAQMRSRSALRLHGVASQHRKQNPFLAYFLSISFISLLVRFFRYSLRKNHFTFESL